MMHPQNVTIHQEGMGVTVNITGKCDEKSHQKLSIINKATERVAMHVRKWRSYILTFKD
jgi:hypothetical protein